MPWDRKPATARSILLGRAGVNLPAIVEMATATEHSTTSATTARCELLAPAGDWDALRAAAANGADAVYFGLADFNARHRAHNFTTEELPEVIDYLHRHNVRGYVTLNTLIFSDELTACNSARSVASL